MYNVYVNNEAMNGQPATQEQANKLYNYLVSQGHDPMILPIEIDINFAMR